MTRIHINASTPYDVVIENGALQRISDYIKPLKPNCRVIIVSDNNVAPHYLSSVKAINIIVIPPISPSVIFDTERYIFFSVSL